MGYNEKLSDLVRPGLTLDIQRMVFSLSKQLSTLGSVPWNSIFFPRHYLSRTLQKVLNETQNKTIKHLLCIILFGVLSFFPYIKSLKDILKSLCGIFKKISCGGLNNNGPLGTDIWKLSHQGNDTALWEGVGSVAWREEVCHWACTLKPLKFLQPTLGHSALYLSRSGCGTFSDFSNTMSAYTLPYSPQCWQWNNLSSYKQVPN